MRHVAPAQADTRASRVVAVDMLRGFAILWVLLYHVWTDLRYPNVYPAQGDAIRAVAHRFAAGDLGGGMTATGEAFLRAGYLGVPLFMLLSGFSLTLAALRREDAAEPAPNSMARRFRRLMVPYWVGFALTLAFAAALALVQWQRHGGAGYGAYLRHGDIGIDGGQLFAGALVAPRILRDEWQFAPEGSLWFVLVVAQYYLLFPALFGAMRRTGPLIFAGATLLITLASLEAMAWSGGLDAHRSWVEMGAPFRLFEFGMGMTLGYFFVRRRETLAVAARRVVAAACLGAGASVFVAACLILPASRIFGPLQAPAVVAGLALMCAPLIGRRAGALERWSAARALAWVGVLSYAVLIVSEPLRSVTHTLSAEHVADGWITLWVIGGLVPLTLLLCRPLAVALGLVRRGSSRLTVADLVGTDDAARRSSARVEVVAAAKVDTGRE